MSKLPSAEVVPIINSQLHSSRGFIMALEPPRLSSHIEKFSGTNFTHWQTKIRLVLMQYNVWKIVKGIEPRPQGEEGLSTWNDKNDRALAIIGLGLADNYIHHLNLDSTTYEVWQNLTDLFGADLNNSKLFLKQQFYKLAIKDTSLKDHLNTMGILVQQLTALKAPPDDDDKKAVLLNSLEDNDSYTDILGVLRVAREMKYEEMVAVLMDDAR